MDGKMKGFNKKGISHRVVHLWLVLIIFIFSGTVVFATLSLTGTFLSITSASKQNSDLKNAAHELMNASDYLTEQVQRFTVEGDVRFMNQYFTEAFESNRREEAVEKMDLGKKTKQAFIKLQDALNQSVELMDIEYYAMRLVIEAKGITDYPDILEGIKLSEEDMNLSSEEKMRRASELVHNDKYYQYKDKIRKSMQDSIKEVDKLTRNIEDAEISSLQRQIRLVRISIIIQAGLIFFLIWLTTRLAIDPILDAVEQIKEDLPIAETGSNEFRYLAGAYNKMYEKNKSNIENLSFKASHDELTGAYNRAGYDFLLANLHLEDTYMMLFDVDDFKLFNDNYGHDVGDKVLIKVVNVIRKVFRDDDCVCRIGGDEFVVFIMHSDGINHQLIESKIKQISTRLENTEDGLPPIYLSIGIVNGKDASDSTDMFEKADEAMYVSKNNGKGSYTFYR
jgi:diguanylate cyclase (GGDEF)-like protein